MTHSGILVTLVTVLPTHECMKILKRRSARQDGQLSECTVRGTLHERVAALNMRPADGQQQATLSTSRGVQYTCSEHCLQTSTATCGSVGKPPVPLQHPKRTALQPVRLRYKLIPGFRREVYEICALPGYYTAYSGNSLSSFRDYLSGPIFKGQEGFSGLLRSVQWQDLPTFRENLSAPLEDGTDRFPEKSARNYHCTLCKNPKERRYVGSEAVRLQRLAIRKSICLTRLPLPFHFTATLGTIIPYITCVQTSSLRSSRACNCVHTDIHNVYTCL